MATQAASNKSITPEFYQESTKVWLHRDGIVKINTGKNKPASAVDSKKGESISEWIQMPLNETGMKHLEEYQERMKDNTLVEWFVDITFPWIRGGIEQFIDKAVMTALETEWAPVLAKTAGKMTLSISGDVVGNARIRINRLMTPTVYAMFCKPYPTDTGKQEKGSKKAPVGIVQM